MHSAPYIHRSFVVRHRCFNPRPAPGCPRICVLVCRGYMCMCACACTAAYTSTVRTSITYIYDQCMQEYISIPCKTDRSTVLYYYTDSTPLSLFLTLNVIRSWYDMYECLSLFYHISKNVIVKRVKTLDCHADPVFKGPSYYVFTGAQHQSPRRGFGRLPPLHATSCL
jgi:hypothetical protein